MVLWGPKNTFLNKNHFLHHLGSILQKINFCDFFGRNFRKIGQNALRFPDLGRFSAGNFQNQFTMIKTLFEKKMPHLMG